MSFNFQYLKHQRNSRSWKESDGAAAVEFAMILFPLTTILMGIINFGYALFGMNQMHSIANETLRAVSYASLSNEEAVDFATEKLQRFGSNSLTIAIDDSNANSTTLTISGGTENLTLVDFPFASLQYYKPRFSVSSTTPKYKLTSVQSGT